MHTDNLLNENSGWSIPEPQYKAIKTPMKDWKLEPGDMFERETWKAKFPWEVSSATELREKLNGSWKDVLEKLESHATSSGPDDTIQKR